MTDLIERQEAYETLTEYYHHTAEIQHKALREALERVPTAQPKKRTEERTETHACDCIDRQAAIDVCNYAIDLWHGQLGEGIVIAVKKKIEELPSAQPEVLACGEGELIAQPETKRCDTCRHEKSQWFNRCADCSDYELWEGKEE